MVVFQDGVAKKAHYRKFGVRGQEGMDDFAAMAEVVSRRFARLGDVTAEDYDESFAAMPNLVVIDGGKGQLSAALAAMHKFDLPRVAVVALAKRIEEVFVPGRPDPIRLDPHSPGLQLLQRIRDEAHRFAVGFHRQRRDSRSFASIFDELEGVGPVRRRARLGGALPRGEPGGARGRSRRSREDGALDLRTTAQSRPRVVTRSGHSRQRSARALMWPIRVEPQWKAALLLRSRRSRAFRRVSGPACASCASPRA
jgi:excinuclease ABC subunit C